MSSARNPLVAMAGACTIAISLIAVASCTSQTALPPAVDHAGSTGALPWRVEPDAAPTPIQLYPGMTIGTDVFPEGDTASGGQGQVVNGIRCAKSEKVFYHHHVHLSLFVNGVQFAIPKGTGMKNPGHGKYIYHSDCEYFLHTHDETGIIHIESPTAHIYTLHDYFYIWGEPLSANDVAGYTGSITVFINGIQQLVDPRTIQFTPYEEITLEVGSPVVPPPVYLFPPGYP